MVKEYIEREAALKEVASRIVWTLSYKAIYEAIQEAPAADVVEIVRCRDCTVPHNRWTGCPKLNGLVTPPDFYCGFGDRKNECN